MECIIIDDDKVSRLLLEKYVSKTDFLNLKASFVSAVDAINSIENFEFIDIIFLDIEMPEMTGIEFIKSLEILPQVIIVSAREKYAIEAIEYDVTDYLLKPISYARFYKAVTKAKNKSEDEKSINKLNGVFIKEIGGNFVRVKYEDILWIEALENYIAIYSAQDKYTIHFTMKSIENQLPESVFYRVHRSFLININKVEAIQDNTVVIKYQNDFKYIPIAKNNKDELLKRLNVITK